MTSAEIVEILQMEPHPEGGWFKQYYQSPDLIRFRSSKKSRNCSTAIYFMLEYGNHSKFHRLKTDEIWHYYAGAELKIYLITPEGKLETHLLGNHILSGHLPTFVYKEGCWIAAEVTKLGNYSLVGCTMAPGFVYEEFEFANGEKLAVEFPEHRDIILRLS